MPRSKRSHGEGSYLELPDGRIRHRISLGRNEFGERIRLSVYGRSKAECRALMARKLEEIRRRGGVPTSDDTTIGEWLTTWLERKRLQPVSEKTYEIYESTIRIHIIPRIGRIRLDRLTVRDVDAWLIALASDAVGGRVRQYARTILVNSLNDAMRAELLERNVAALTHAPRHTKAELVAWDIDEALAFLRAASGDRYHAFWVLWLTIGARPHELLGLRQEDLNLAAASLSITKQLRRGGAERVATKTPTARRTLMLTPFAVEALHSHRERILAEGLRASPWLFPTPTGKATGYRNLIMRHYEPLIQQAKVRRIRPYDLRHTYATLALKAGVPVKVVSETLGHRNIELTLRTYAHVLASMREEHVERIQSLFAGTPSGTQAGTQMEGKAHVSG